MKTILAMAAAALTMAGCATMTPGQKTEQARQVAHALNARDYKIRVRTAYPARGASIPVTPDFYLAVRGDSIDSYLPFFGRAWSPLPYGISKGLNFEGRIRDYNIKQVKKNMARIRFVVKNEEDLYKYQIEVYDDGGSTIDVQPQKRERMRYDGEME